MFLFYLLNLISRVYCSIFHNQTKFQNATVKSTIHTSNSSNTVLLFLFLGNSPNVYTLVWKHINKWRNICIFQIPSAKKNSPSNPQLTTDNSSNALNASSNSLGPWYYFSLYLVSWVLVFCVVLFLVFISSLECPMLPVFLECLFLVVPSVFSNVYEIFKVSIG